MMRILTHRHTHTHAHPHTPHPHTHAHAHTHPYTHHTHTHMNKHTHTAIHTCIQVSHTITTSIYLTRFTIIQTLSHSRKLILTNALYSTSHFLYLTRDSGEREIECETGEIDKTTKRPGFQFSVALAQMRWTRPLNKHSLVFRSKTI